MNDSAHRSANPEGIASVNIVGVQVQNISRQELLAKMHRGVLFTPNTDLIMKMRLDPDFYRIFHQAEFRVCDSRIVQWVARFLGTPIAEKIAGSDIFGEFCEHHRHNPEIRIFLLGAAPGVALEAQRRVNARIGREIVVAAHSPSFGFERDEGECSAIIELINQSGANVLAVGLGAPKQEKWIMQHRHRMPAVQGFMAIGATLDFEAGNVPRAPKFMQYAGLEWAYRLLREPRRLWRRYLLENPPFLWLALKQKLGMDVTRGLPRL